jgi:hypothetical protein
VTKIRHSALAAIAALSAQLCAVLLLPALHAAHHLHYGADHRHAPDGATVPLAAPDEQREHVHGGSAEALHHALFDADLEALDLVEVAHAGTLAVDCELADFTFAICPVDLPASHPHTFGDELLARAPHHHEPAADPLHGSGALAHLGVSLLATPIYLVPPRSAPELRAVFVFAILAPPAAPMTNANARAPPTRS